MIKVSSTVLTVTLFYLLSNSEVLSAELQQPIQLITPGLSAGVSAGATDPPGAVTTCANLPPISGGVSPAQLVVRNADRPDVGPYTVKLPGYGTGTDPNAPQFYRPFLVTARPATRFALTS